MTTVLESGDDQWRMPVIRGVVGGAALDGGLLSSSTSDAAEFSDDCGRLIGFGAKG